LLDKNKFGNNHFVIKNGIFLVRPKNKDFWKK
jgi:hypothetical protein